MRKSLIYVVLALLAVLSPATARSESTKPAIPKLALSINYWSAELIKSYPTRSEQSDQHFFPVFIGSAHIKGKFSAIGEWGQSGFGGVTPESVAGQKEKASRTVFGLRFDAQPGIYYTLSYPIMKLNIDNDAGIATTAKITGAQLGMGIGTYIKEPHITTGGELNIVPDMGIKYTRAALWGKGKGPGIDIKYTIAYKFDNGSAAYIGYRYMMLDTGAATLGSYPAPKIKFRLRGPLVGFKYAF